MTKPRTSTDIESRKDYSEKEESTLLTAVLVTFSVSVLLVLFLFMIVFIGDILELILLRILSGMAETPLLWAGILTSLEISVTAILYAYMLNKEGGSEK